MTIGNVSPSASVQANLLALQSTANLLNQTQEALSTGDSINSASDNASAFFASQDFLQQASSLADVKNNLSTALTTLNSTTSSVGDVTQVVQQLQGITAQALGTTDPTARANLASQYNALLPQLDSLANDANFNGANLLNSTSNSLTVPLNGTNTASLTVPGVNATSSGLDIAPVTNNFATTADINAANSQLSAALSTLSTASSNFGSNATLIETNQDFSSNLINNLQTASDNLTVADANAEGAGLLALQAQNQLGIVSLGISGQLSQSILRLFQS